MKRVVKNSFIFFLIFGILFSFVHTSDVNSEENDGVVQSEEIKKEEKTLIFIENEEHFYYIIDNNKNILTLFSKQDENCVDCQIAFKEIEKTIEKYNGDCEYIFINCLSSATYSICQNYEVGRLPTISLLSEQLAAYEFTEFLVSDNLINFIEKFSVPKTIIASTDLEIETIIHDNRAVIIGFFTPDNSEELGAFRRTAANLIFEYPFIEVHLNENNQKVVEKYEIEVNSVVLFKEIAGEKSHHSFSPPYSRKRLTSFIHANAPVQIFEGTNENFQKMETFKKPIFAIFFKSAERSEENKQAFFDFQLIAEKYQNVFSFSFSVLSEDKVEEYEDLKRWGFSLSNFPIMLIYNLYTREAFTFDETKPIDLFSMNKFSTDYLSGKLEPQLIKQAIPSNNNQNVKVVVFDNYRKVVHDHTKDVAVLFYLPEDMCKHCSDFVKAFENAADLLISSPLFENVIFAKMDMFANQFAPGLNIHAFPSLLYFPKYDKYNEVTFSAKRTTENIVQWLNDQATISSSSTTKNFEDLTALDDYII